MSDCVSLVALLPGYMCVIVYCSVITRMCVCEWERLCVFCSVMCVWVSDCRCMVDSEPRKFSVLTWLRPRSRSPASRIKQIRSLHVKIMYPRLSMNPNASFDRVCCLCPFIRAWWVQNAVDRCVSCLHLAMVHYIFLLLSWIEIQEFEVWRSGWSVVWTR
jgi:hypothetical protein